MITSEKRFNLDAWSITDNIKLMKNISQYLQDIGCFKYGSMCEITVKVFIIHEGNERQANEKEGG